MDSIDYAGNIAFLNGLEFIPIAGPENTAVTQKIAECRATLNVPSTNPVAYIDPHTFETTYMHGSVKMVFALVRLPVHTKGGGVYKIIALVPKQEELTLPRLISDGEEIDESVN